jgi:pimeloyl-ACP methyl ester carboxylesterase
VGASYGATLALHAAAASTENIASLALYEPPLLIAGGHLLPVLGKYKALLSGGDFDNATSLFVREVSRVPTALLEALAVANADKEPDPAESRRSAIGSLRDLEALASDSTDMARWAGIDVPVLLLQGADTWEPVPSGMDQLAAALPHAQRVVFAGQSHFASTVAPLLVAEELRRFLTGLKGDEPTDYQASLT